MIGANPLGRAPARQTILGTTPTCRCYLSTTMKRYNPLTPPDPERWQATDEEGRTRLVEDYHRRARIRLPNVRLHAMFHVVVENQIALGDEIPVARTVQRLMAEGLDRHDALHAVGSELTGLMHDLFQNPDAVGRDVNEPYFAALESLTAEKWLRSG